MIRIHRLALVVSASVLALVTATGCAVDAPPPEEPAADEPAVEQVTQPLKTGLGIDRECPEFMYWCKFTGSCIGTDKVCYDRDKPAPVAMGLIGGGGGGGGLGATDACTECKDWCVRNHPDLSAGREACMAQCAKWDCPSFSSTFAQ